MSADIAVTARGPARPDDEVTIIVGGQEISGWATVEVTLRLEGFPNSFSVAMSYEPAVEAVAIAGAACVVLLGNDVVVSGYVDRRTSGTSEGSHQIQLVGRGKTQDLVDCSAEWPTGQRTDVDALTIAQTIAGAYGIVVELGGGATAGPAVPQWLLNYGETGAEIIQRVARAAGLLAYEDPHGSLILGIVGETIAASGVSYGDNVQDFSIETGMDQRVSDIVCARLGTDTLGELGGDDFYDFATDPNVPRHRLLYAVLEAVGADDPAAFTSRKAHWDLARRAGRSTVVRATVDSWRDSAGMLWTPNTLVPVNLPGNSAGALPCLSEVTFRRSNESGTTADLVLMPKVAFSPEPISLNPVSVAEVQGPDQAQ